MRHHLMFGLGVALALALAGPSLLGQGRQVQAAPAIAAEPLDSLHFRQLGPASTAGRVSDLAVFEANPAVFYVATAHSGVWKTLNNGTTFEPQFQKQGLMSVGDVAVSQSNPDLVWIGTGESNNRQSRSWGDGAYKSADGGKMWSALMGGIWPGEQVMKAYAEAKAQTPKVVADVNAALARASALAASLAKYKVTLAVPDPVKLAAAAPAPDKKK